MLSNVGKEFIASAVIGIDTSPFDFAHAMIGVGNSEILSTSTQTDLLGTYKFRKFLDVGYPKISETDPSLVIFKATFTELEANFPWEEWGIFNSSPDQTGGIMLMREIEPVGIKEIGSIWRFTASVKFENY